MGSVEESSPIFGRDGSSCGNTGGGSGNTIGALGLFLQSISAIFYQSGICKTALANDAFERLFTKNSQLRSTSSILCVNFHCTLIR